ncbi:hypothetical protein DW355_06605 [Hylemonella gracilis]|uniref:Apea-like HEPN domain-containing protein n=1 Tax=Hylemonella gracilis TaxID=80880 RepID=A0A4P6UK62_9BURK|nr:hypothetical protein [Hylemonella gracilis]QBK04500.1 hypothetical protein DW355_06605 [Hylemonella gracilis]
MSAKLDQLAFRFFKLFAQYEYALKAMGYGRAGNADAAEPEWDRFANEVGTLLLQAENPDVVAARTYLFENPPKRQVWVNGNAAWAEVPNVERSAQMLVAHIRRVRNNLYHGGKFHGQWIDPDRSLELLSKSLLLLEHLVSADAGLHEAIQGNAV